MHLPEKKAEPRELSAVEKLLRQANNNLAANSLEAAVEQFQQVLEGDAANGEALYGLGLVATMKNGERSRLTTSRRRWHRLPPANR